MTKTNPIELSYKRENAYAIEQLNASIRSDARKFADESETIFSEKLRLAADTISDNRRKSPIVLLSGPSGSGKTTSAKRIAELLEKRGIRAHTISLDDYFIDPHLPGSPRLPNGEPDLESPMCVDWTLLGAHFEALERGDAIDIPWFDFLKQSRNGSRLNLKLGEDEIAVFEGIHALNNRITDDHPEAFRLYISARSDFTLNGTVVWKRTLTRLMRRTIRDHNFRGTPPEETLYRWDNVRDGEKKYISPFRQKAHMSIDTTIPYEISLMKSRIAELFKSAPKDASRYTDAESILNLLPEFEPIDDKYVPLESILREFIGGGLFND